ncbi:MAG: hypothetical protein ACTSQE_00005 [Candidatus Heimdallarchaeaceae archaeon]
MREERYRKDISSSIIITSFLERKLRQLNEIKREINDIRTLKEERTDLDLFRLRSRLHILAGEIELFGGNIAEEVQSIIQSLYEGNIHLSTEEVNKLTAKMYHKIFTIVRTANLEEKILMMRDIILQELSFKQTEKEQLPFERVSQISFSESRSDLDFLFITLATGLPFYAYMFEKQKVLKKKYKIIATLNFLERFFPELAEDKAYIGMKESGEVILREKREKFTILLFVKKYNQILRKKIEELANYAEVLVEEFPPEEYMKGKTLNEITKLLDKKIRMIFGY